ncbi:MAG: SRPBCC family protein [Candidatus Dormibacteraeota bacterium]|nr:SRPBCC family protein [Candidatus Dormibacteraeota bacterium]
MQIQNEFEVAAPPERVYAFLLDVNRIVNCMPGAELSEVVDPNTFNGKVKIKVGPITVSYKGTARISERDEAAHRATLQAEGRETTGPGSARATAVMTVEPADSGSRVRLATDFNVAGRVANFGRGVMEDVSRRLVNQMAACIKSNLEAAEAQEETTAAAPAAAGSNEPPQGGFQPPAAPARTEPAPAEPAGPRSEAAPAESAAPAPAPAAAPAPAPTPVPRPAPSATVPAAAKPVNALSLFFAILWDRIKRLFGRG